MNRLTASWRGSVLAIDADLKSDLDKLRARSRDLAQNNDYMRKFLRMVARNVVGPHGFVLQARAMNGPAQPDTAANAAIEAAWWKWCKRGNAEITGRMSFADLCRTTMQAVARDGEALVRIVRGREAGNPFQIALQLLDVARLDTLKNLAPVRGQNTIIMGVEIDDYQRPVAYWLRPLDQIGPSTRIPASDLLHLYVVDNPEQTRGIPWGHAAILRLHNLKGYEEAAVVAARVGAAKMGFFTNPDGDPAGLGEQGADGQFYTTAEAGEFGVLPSGYGFQSFDPDYPHNQYGEFVKACLRGVASGFDVAYNGLANDLDGVSYSSIRAGVLEERDQWMTVQSWCESALLEPVYSEWFDAAMLTGQISTVSGATLPAAKRDKFFPHAWQGRRWSWVDPLKDIEASRLAVQSGITSPQDVAAQQGKDIEDVLDDIAVFQAMAAAKGVSIVSYAPPSAGSAAPAEAPATEADAAEDTARHLANVTQMASELYRAAADMQVRTLDAARQPAPIINVAAPEVRIENPAPVVNIAAPEIRMDATPVHVTVEAPNVTVQPAEVHAHFEATMEPDITVNAVMPARRTQTEIVRDSKGNIVSASQTDQDA